MIPRSITTIGWLATATLPFLAAPAWAAPPDPQPVVHALGLAGQEISLTELRTIRGGFDLNNSLSIGFAFTQIETVNGIIVKSIMVPETNVTAAAYGSSAYSGTHTAQGSTNTTIPAVTVTDATGNTKTITPSAGSNINVSTTANNGLTTINTQFGSNGLTNMTANEANNTAISVAATMNISVSGLNQTLARQQSFANTQSGLYYAGSAFK